MKLVFVIRTIPEENRKDDHNTFLNFCLLLKIDYSQTKWRVAKYITSFHDSTSNKNEEDAMYFA